MTTGTQPRQAGLTLDLLGYTASRDRARLVHAVDPHRSDQVAVCGAGRIRTLLAAPRDHDDPSACRDCWHPAGGPEE